MRVLAMALIGLLAAGCDRRSEEPLLQGAHARPTSPTPAMEEPVADAFEDRCMVPTDDKAPAPVQAASSCPADPTPDFMPLPTARVTFPQAPDQPELTVELAGDSHSRQRGLMYRTHLAEQAGMLFRFPRPAVQGFWMHNTCLALDMMFIDSDGFIAGVLENVPPMNDETRTVPCPVQYVLEANAGWARRHGVRAGQYVKLPDTGVWR